MLVKYLYREMSEYEVEAFRGWLTEDPSLRGRLEAVERTLTLLGEIPARPAGPHVLASIQAAARREAIRKKEGKVEEPAGAAHETPERKGHRPAWKKTWMPLLIGAAIALAIVAAVWFMFFRGT